MKEFVNIGMIGLSGRGSGMLRELLKCDGVRVPAVCDKYEDRAKNGAEIVKEEAGNEPDVYLDYKEMLKREDLDAVFCATTWITHARIATDAMRAGKHVAMEVGGAASIEECWQMVRASEETGKFCMLLENCCYDRKEMAIYNMVKQGLFGEIIHMQGGYQHDLRDEISLGRENRHGRLYNFQMRNGELYPTHQLGPISKVLGINRGNRYLSVCSMASKSRGLNEWIKENKGEDYDLADYSFNQGDIVTTMLRCANGETVVLTHDCSLPRHYSRAYRVQGTKGIYMEDGNSIYLEGRTKHVEGDWMHQPENFDDYLEEFEHPLWKKYQQDGVHAGHGGMDYLVLSAFAESVRLDAKPPIDVYDAAVWMAVTCLSEQSIAIGGAPVPFPDFTNGMWIDREPYRRGKFCLDEVCSDCFEEK
ncbi:MAG: Gfo/Idh/MocA family oxidoreductase [Acutalibacteraceae bacterium]|nr:Gfo/Idh/MocA family oxidoreductase [Acutalibacteraceae bacterium]